MQSFLKQIHETDFLVYQKTLENSFEFLVG